MYKLKYFLLLLPTKALAASSIITDPTGDPINNPQSIIDFISTLQTIANSVAGILAFGAIVWGAFLYATAAGNPEKAAQGKKVLLYGLGGALIIVLSIALVRIFIVILGGTA